MGSHTLGHRFADMVFEAAIFDLDGTLFDSSALWKELPVEFMKMYGIEMGEALERPSETQSIREGIRFIKDKYRLPGTEEELLLAYYELLRENYQKRVPMMPDAAKLLQSLHEKGIRLCVATAAEKEMTEAALARCGVLQWMDFVLTEEEVGASKRYPDIYLQAARRLGVDPETCLVFDDAPHAVETAHGAGFTVCGVAMDEETMQRLLDTHCCYKVAGSFQEIMDMVK